MQEMAQHFNGVVSPSPEREFGRAVLSFLADESIKTHPQAKTIGSTIMRLFFVFFIKIEIFSFPDLFHEVDVSSTGDELTMWMSHGDKVSVLPPGFVKVAATANSDHAAIADIRYLFSLNSILTKLTTLSNSRRMYGKPFEI